MGDRRLGRYQLIRHLATGGMGEIYLAEHTGLSGFAKRVALKRISTRFAKEPSYVDLFLNEARVGSFLNHPNIVHIFDVGHENDELWLVMEYVNGVDLKRLLRRAKLAGQSFSPVLLAAVMIEVLSALTEAHAGGPTRGAPIIHRDLSPENVLIARSGAVKVLDFGLAKWSPGSTSVPSMEGNLIFGKIRYMPPEQLSGGLIDVRADLFALGVVMYEALSGSLPFGSEDANSILAAIVRSRPRPPSKTANQKSPALDAIVLKALEPEPDRRFQTAAEMRNELVSYVEDSPERLPLEQLRRLLLPEAPLAVSGPNTNVSDMADRAATEIGLRIAKRCGKCGGTFRAFFLDALIVDRCADCRGVWLDFEEVHRILGRQSGAVKFEHKPLRRAPLDQLIGSCPGCRVGLRAFNVPDHSAALEVCPICFGVWFDRGELRLLQEDDVATWFRTLLESMRAEVVEQEDQTILPD